MVQYHLSKWQYFYPEHFKGYLKVGDMQRTIFPLKGNYFEVVTLEHAVVVVWFLFLGGGGGGAFLFVQLYNAQSILRNKQIFSLK